MTSSLVATIIIINDNDGNDEEQTVPNTPEDGSFSKGSDGENGDFARLIPANRAAQVAFNDVVDKLRTPYSGWDETGLEKYMHIDRVKVSLRDDYSSTDTETEVTEIPTTLWTGYYRLNLEIPPSNGNIGWVVGRGRS